MSLVSNGTRVDVDIIVMNRDHVMDIKTEQVMMSIYKHPTEDIYVGCGPSTEDSPMREETNYSSLLNLIQEVVGSTLVEDEDEYDEDEYAEGVDTVKLYIELDKNYSNYLTFKKEIDDLFKGEI